MQTAKDELKMKEEALRAGAIKVNIEYSLVFLQEVFRRKSYNIRSNYPTISNIGCEVWKEEKGFGFETDNFNDVPAPVQFQSTLYGVTKISELEREGQHFLVKDGPINATVPLFRRFHGQGKFNSFESNINEDLGYFIAVIPCKPGVIKPVDIVLGEPFRDSNWVRAYGYITIKISNIEVGFYDFTKEKDSYLIIESKSQIAFSQFKKISEVVIYNFGLLSGCLERKEMFTIRSMDSLFEKINAFQIKEIDSSLWGLPALNPKEHRRLYNLSASEYMPLEVFNNLINISLDIPEIFRTIRIVTESFEYPFHIQASTYSVALETIKNIIVRNKEEELRPIKDKKVALQFVNDIKNIMSYIDDSEFNNRATIEKKIDNINSLGNSESLIKIFDLLGISLNEDDRRCISNRNDFLHGRMPFEVDSEVTNDFELHHVVYKLHFLICACILKLAGFSGYLRNNLKMADIAKFNKGVKEETYRKI